MGSSRGLHRRHTSLKGRRKNGQGRCRRTHLRLNLCMRVMEVWMLLVCRLTAVLLDNLGDNGVTMATMPMMKAIIVDRHRRAVAADMHGKVMVRFRGCSWVLPVASLRGLLIRVFGNEEVTEAIVVVGVAEGAGTVHVPATTCCCRPDDSSRGC